MNDSIHRQRGSRVWQFLIAGACLDLRHDRPAAAPIADSRFEK